MAYQTFGLNRGQYGAITAVALGTLDVATLQNQGTALATDSAALTAESGSMTSTFTLGHTIIAGDVTLVGSLATTAANIAAESGSITAAAGTVVSDMFFAVNTGLTHVPTQMDARLAMEVIEQFILSGIPYNSTVVPQGNALP